MFIVVLVMQIRLSVLPEALQVFRGERCLPISCYIPKLAYNKTLLLYALRLVLYASNGTLWIVISGMHETHYKHNLLVSSSVFNNNLDLLIYGCMWDENMLIHILRYIGRTGNNNKMLNNNSSCCFTSWVMVT